jgi:hypothetical protein
MTLDEVKANLNNVRVTLKSDETKLLAVLDQVMGCEMLVEQLIAEMNKSDQQPDKKEG